jgi:hypothetical protein
MFFDIALDEPHQLARDMKNTNAMSKPRMRSSGVDQVRKTQLLDSAQALKWLRLNDVPHDHLELIDTEFD